MITHPQECLLTAVIPQECLLTAANTEPNKTMKGRIQS